MSSPFTLRSPLSVFIDEDHICLSGRLVRLLPGWVVCLLFVSSSCVLSVKGAISIEGSVHSTNYHALEVQSFVAFDYLFVIDTETWSLTVRNVHGSEKPNRTNEWVFSDGRDLFWRTLTDKSVAIPTEASKGGSMSFPSFMTIFPAGHEGAVISPWPRLVLLAHGMVDTSFGPFLRYPFPALEGRPAPTMGAPTEGREGCARSVVFRRPGYQISNGARKTYPSPFDSGSIAALACVKSFTNVAERLIPLVAEFRSTAIAVAPNSQARIETNNISVIEVTKVTGFGQAMALPSFDVDTGVMDARFEKRRTNHISSSMLSNSVNYVLKAGAAIPIRNEHLDSHIVALTKDWKAPRKPVSVKALLLLGMFGVVLCLPLLVAGCRYYQRRVHRDGIAT